MSDRAALDAVLSDINARQGRSAMRCLVCEELIELIDTCEACLRLEREPAPLKRTGRRSASSQPAGICIRGHVMIIVAGRWRCKQCEAMYNERKRQQRRAKR